MSAPDVIRAKVRTIDEDRLSMISRMSQSVAGICKSDMVEVKSFYRPPCPVKDTIEAVLILMGERDASWEAAKRYLGKIGDESLFIQIAHVDPETITLELRRKANLLLSRYSLDEIRNVNKATVSIFEWAVAVVED